MVIRTLFFLLISIPSFANCSKILHVQDFEMMHKLLLSGSSKQSEYANVIKSIIDKMTAEEVSQKVWSMYEAQASLLHPHPFLSRYYRNVNNIIALDLDLWIRILDERVYKIDGVLNWMQAFERAMLLRKFIEFKNG